ncbi:hypothetical protein KPL71_015385 [Citrus sinensis]|uniref:Uncharacterized protein n=1 Tax=Citrus sinensis TaxID=2711 RepID=A0ACB8KIH9_CITSI|nr:hypothetical protein KPL71_015385 [Citrus sinensis]
MATQRLDVEKFTGENDFHLWRLKMRALLVHQGIEEVLEDPRTSKKISKVKDEDMQEAMDKAHSTIILSLGDGVLREVGDQTTAAGLWKKLEDLYTKKSLTKRLSTKKRLYTLQMEEGSSLTTHIDAFNRIILDLEDINVKIEDEDKAIILLSSLPPSYEHFVDTLLYGRQSLAMQDVKEALSSKESFKKSETKDGEGLTEGHFKRDCPERKIKPKDANNRNGNAVVASEDSDERYDSAGVLVASNMQTEGSVRLKMSDGIIRELDNVRHIPELKRNLISLSMLGVMQHGLYILQGTTITGDAGIVIKQEQDKILLWHFRLGHDMWGPAQIESLGGACYFLSMIDDFSRMVWVYPIRSKDQAFDRFKAWKTLIETQTNRKVRRVRTDNGLEFCNKQFDVLCEKSGIQRHKTVRHTPQQNGLAERMNRTLMERVKCMLFHSKLPKTLWAEALCTACYLINRCPSTAIELKTPYKVWSGKLTDYTKLRIFGCTAYAHIKQGKLEPRALKCAFLGYPSGTKGYKLWCVDLKPPKYIISRDVIFNESEMLKNQTSAQSTIQKIPGAETPHFDVELLKTEDGQNTSHTGETQGSNETSAQSLEHTSIQDNQLTRDRQKRQVRAPERLGYADLIAYALTAAQNVDQEEPKTYEEAVACKESAQWIKAMEDEMDSLNKNGTWKLIQKPEGRKVVGYKWVYKIKDGIPDVEPKRFKARHTSIRIILSLVAVYDMHLEQLDVKTAFLHGDLQEEIVMSQPGGFVNTQHPDWVCLLQKSLYGLKQSPRQWLSSQQCPSTESKQTEMLKTPYASSVGCLMYAMVLTRLDLSDAVSMVSRFMSNPEKEHWRAVKWILRYLRGTTSYGLLYGGERANYNLVEGSVDSDYTGDLDNRRSLTCFLFTLNSCTISWKASLQSVVALSTTEAEYTAAAEAFKEAIWLRGMINELGYEQSSITILCDNQSAISLSKNQVHHEKTKHIDIKLHFIRLEVSKGTVKLVKVYTSNNVADMLTKPVPMAKFEHCLNLAGICRI